MAKANELDLDDDLGLGDDLDLGGDLELNDDLDMGGELGDDLSDDLGADLDADLDSDLGSGLDDDLGEADGLSDDLGDDLGDLDSDLDADAADLDGDMDLDADLDEGGVDLSNLEEELGEAAVEAPEVEEIGDLDADALDEELGEFAVEEGDKDDQVELDASLEVPQDMADADAFEEEAEPAMDLDDDLGGDLDAGLEDDLGDMGMDDIDSAPSDDADPFAMPGGLHEDEEFNLHEEAAAPDEYALDEDADLDVAGAMMSDYEADAGDDGVSDDLEEQAFSYSSPFEQPPATSYHAPEQPAAAAPQGAGMLEKNILFKLPHQLTVEVGKASLKGEDITSLTYGSIIELDRKTGDPVDIVLGGEVIAKGEVVRINEDQLGVRITRIDI